MIPRAAALRHLPGPADDTVALTYDARLLRRKRLTGQAGTAFLVDLPRATSVQPGAAFVLDDGRHVAVEAAPEALLSVTGDLARLAWHVGNRHAPAQIEADRLLVAFDPVMAEMLRGLGARTERITAPFTPEGGAYGPAHMHGHGHGPDRGHAHG
ncbi:MAG: urease accessory protein UreE [Paracoccaceae bacterium]